MALCHARPQPKVSAKELNKRISVRMANQLATLDPSFVEVLVQRAVALEKRSGNRTPSLDPWIERVMKKDARAFAQASHRLSGVVAGVMGPTGLVETELGMLTLQLLGQPAVVGDRVEVAIRDDGEAGLLEIQPRKSKLSRPNVNGTRSEQVIVANVDLVVIVVSVVSPPLHPRLIDRYAVACQQGGITPAVFVNKIDLLQDRRELSVLDPYRKAGFKIAEGSAQTGRGIESLKQMVQGQICALVGHSGVGKSATANALCPSLNLTVGALMEGYGRGAHTTTTSSLHRLEDGTTLIDTPGIRSFGLHDLAADEIAGYYPEFAGLTCRFSDCSHLHEPGCGVIAAVDSGRIEVSRYNTYVRLRSELR